MRDCLAGRVAIVTGAGQGIGRGIALFLARAGADVVVNDVVLNTAQDTANEIAKLGRRSLVVQADVSDAAQVNRMVEHVLEELGDVHILVNNAGIAIPAHITELGEDTWDRTMAVNLKSMFLCSKAVAPIMMEQRYGKNIFK